MSKHQPQPAQVVEVAAGGVDGSPVCSLYHPGHQAHFIQVRKARGSAPIPLTFVALRGRCVRTIDPEGKPMNFCNHDPGRLARAVERSGGRDIRLYDYGILAIGGEVFCVNRGTRLIGACRSSDGQGQLGVTGIVI